MYNCRKRSYARLITLCVVLAVHAGAIFIPLGMMFYAQSHPKPIPFRVKLGGTEPSTGPEVGPPERILPLSTNGGGGTPPPKKTDDKKLEQERLKKLQEQKKEQERLKKLQEQKKIQQKKKEQERLKKLQEQKKLQQKKKEQERLKKLQEQKKIQQRQKERERLARLKAQRERERQKRLQEQVYSDPKWKNWDPNKPAGGTNFNNAVRVGTRDAAQKRGTANNGTPAGGASVKEEEYWKKFQEYFLERWQPPPGILINSSTAVEVEIRWDSRGRVLSKRITQSSPNPAVTQSVKILLEQLDFVPTPPAGVATSARFRLIPD